MLKGAINKVNCFQLINDSQGKSEQEFNALRKAMLICIPYAANIGGTATLIGTGPNLILLSSLDAR